MPGGKTIIGIIAIGLLAAAFIYAGRPHAAEGTDVALVATLTGTEEVPPADPAGSGLAAIGVNQGQRTVSWEITVQNIDQATAAQIHHAPTGMNGPVVVSLSAPTDGRSSGTTNDVDRNLIKDLIEHPDQYYVNVANADFPNGAIRGQLSHRGQDN